MNHECAQNCSKEKCSHWIVLTQQNKKEGGEIENVPIGKCSIDWIPVLLIELKESILNKG